MGKNKSKSKAQKKKYSDPNRAKKRFQNAVRSESTPAENPFELRVNKQKHTNLGRIGKNEKGRPGVSRGKAIEKRKVTLLQEYKVRNKSSVLLDKRIGEKNKEMPEDEKFVRRSALEKARQYKRKSIFSLQDDDELLTHKGKSLVNIDRYEDPREQSDSEDERLNEEFVSEANFSGFMRMKKKGEENEDEFDGKSRQEIIAELIQNSKQKKFEKAKETDELFELREKLDQEFKSEEFRSLLMGVGSSNKISQEKQKEKDITEDYDRLVKELQFETKTGCASDRKKTEEEIALEEKELLEKMEKDRIKRMSHQNVDAEHRSADDLNDGFDLDDDPTVLSYTLDGIMVSSNNGQNSEDFSDKFDCFTVPPDSEDGTTEEDDDASDSDLKDKSKSQKKKSNLATTDVEIVVEQELPFVVQLPETYSGFVKILKTYGANVAEENAKSSLIKLKILLERIFKYNRASNKSKMWMLFCHILRYSFDTVFHWKTFSNEMVELCKISVSFLHSILALDPTRCSEEFYKVLDSARSMFNDIAVVNYPMMFLLQCCPLLFYSTDFRHKIVSPANIFLLQLISEYKVTDFAATAKIIYLCSIALEYYSVSKRFSSEPLNSLSSLLLCYCSSLPLRNKIIPAIRPVCDMINIKEEELLGSPNVTTLHDAMLNINVDCSNQNEVQTNEKLGLLSRILDLISKFLNLYEALPSAYEIGSAFTPSLEEIRTRNWPKEILEKIESILTCIVSLKKGKVCLRVNDQKPKPLKLYEPLIEENFDGMKHRKGDKKKQEQSRLQYKIKQETRSAVREIKLDNVFLAKQQLKETMHKDMERKRKVKELMGSLANQEGDYQKMKRQRK